jgi:BirA family biotin operon repressor/biotin-[acetyl-CoA-carboxylase] ligase
MSTVEKVDRLDADQLQAALSSTVISRKIIVLEQTGSTNDAILQFASPQRAAVTNLADVASAKEGSPPLVDDALVLFAEHQTAGLGQRGNRWESAAGKGLWFSILLRRQIQINESWRLTIWAIEAISEVLRAEFALDSTIKMPNDVQIHGRKVAGVLIEMRAQKKAAHLAVVGIGINVNHSLEDFSPELESRAISLAMALRRPVNRQELAIAVLRTLDRTYCERFPAQAS